MEAIYAGTAKVVPTKFGEMTKVSFNRTDLEKLTKYLNENDSEWVNLVIKEKKEKQPGKPTHYLQVDDWKPTAVKEKNEFAPVVAKKEIIEKYEKDTLPF
jgi:hypothetical protein